MHTFLGNLAPLPGNTAEPHPIDMVVHLGRTHRFGGFGSTEWTVLHHSMLTAMLYMRYFGENGAVYALLHDAHEYVTGDVPSPVKACFGKTEVKALETELDERIYKALALSWPNEDVRNAVKLCDYAALIIEAFYFAPKGNGGTFDHIGEMDWPRLSRSSQDMVMMIIYKSVPEVYMAMCASKTYTMRTMP